jgi:hypothetical protein
MRPRSLAVLTAFAVAGGLGGCGSDDEFSTAIPKTAPDLTIPTATTDTPAAQQNTATSTTQTTQTTQTTTGSAGAPGDPAAPAPPAAQPPATPPPAAPAGTPTTGQAPQGQSTTGGAQAGGGEFDNFCEQNPGVTC